MTSTIWRVCCSSFATSSRDQYGLLVSRILIVADERGLLNEISSGVEDDDTELIEALTSEQALKLAAAHEPDLVIADSQIQSRGGVALAFDLSHEETGGRLSHIPFLLLLDRRADVFLAKRASVEGYLVKPLDPIRLRRAKEALLKGENFADESFAPPTVAWS
jgi:DNA-binding NarL/FixJ family response regulator